MGVRGGAGTGRLGAMIVLAVGCGQALVGNWVDAGRFLLSQLLFHLFVVWS